MLEPHWPVYCFSNTLSLFSLKVFVLAAPEDRASERKTLLSWTTWLSLIMQAH